MEQIVEKSFKVGDKIVVKNRLGGTHVYPITRITKTMAISEWKNSAGIKCSERFGIKYLLDGNYTHITRHPREAFVWDTNTYNIIEG